ncbi:5-methyltetrahydropteroyltriglutamate--homocysteine S-methyltransferase [Intestinibacillus sp. Marseille-P6563]|uniref:5-methyltetrahydropteroyltriglutamate-- homocysteine S-methyltransferase n=1 Tax=Intestinibacillus sp. Marseille-P6563 TaxID=2364792 RepID=UPI000F05EB20|nr:5-methyltetrahydropteroyltriglutamate--homocysteine S-methyltransferase [Intestinibacillus sp. Marseille-P6563]
MYKENAPFRYDFVGSFLRPACLKKARGDYTTGNITIDDLTRIENEEVEQLIRKQKAAGYHVITDGEFRRSYWHLDFMWGFQGIEQIELDHGYFFHGEETTHGSIAITSTISGENHPFVEHFKFVKQFEDKNTVARQTIPAPAQLYAELFREKNGQNTRRYYPDDEKLICDIAAAYRTVIGELYKAGCRNIQFDDCTWGMFCDKKYWETRQNAAVGLTETAEKFLYLNNLALEGRPDDLVVTTHICRGNYHSTWASSGGYEPIAEILFGQENVDAFYLEFDDERSGGFEPLRFVPNDKKVVLGLLTSKSPVLESEEAVIARIHEAARFVQMDNLCLSPQCGFASCEIGNKLTEDEQWNKLALVKQIAEKVW